MKAPRFLATLAALGLTGCAPALFERANTLGAHHQALGVDGSGMLAVEKDALAPPPSRARVEPAADVGLEGAWGVTDRLDLGGRVALTGADFRAKFQLTPRDRDKFVLSVMPSVGAVVLPYFVLLRADLAVLAGFGLGRGMQLVVAGKLDASNYAVLTPDANAAGNGLSAGASIGVAIPVGGGVELLPEISSLFPLGVAFSATSTRREATVQGGVAVKFYR